MGLYSNNVCDLARFQQACIKQMSMAMYFVLFIGRTDGVSRKYRDSARGIAVCPGRSTPSFHSVLHDQKRARGVNLGH